MTNYKIFATKKTNLYSSFYSYTSASTNRVIQMTNRYMKWFPLCKKCWVVPQYLWKWFIKKWSQENWYRNEEAGPGRQGWQVRWASDEAPEVQLGSIPRGNCGDKYSWPLKIQGLGMPTLDVVENLSITYSRSSIQMVPLYPRFCILTFNQPTGPVVL